MISYPFIPLDSVPEIGAILNAAECIEELRARSNNYTNPNPGYKREFALNRLQEAVVKQDDELLKEQTERLREASIDCLVQSLAIECYVQELHTALFALRAAKTAAIGLEKRSTRSTAAVIRVNVMAAHQLEQVITTKIEQLQKQIRYLQGHSQVDRDELLETEYKKMLSV